MNINCAVCGNTKTGKRNTRCARHPPIGQTLEQYLTEREITEYIKICFGKNRGGLVKHKTDMGMFYVFITKFESFYVAIGLFVFINETYKYYPTSNYRFIDILNEFAIQKKMLSPPSFITPKKILYSTHGVDIPNRSIDLSKFYSEIASEAMKF